MAGDKRLSGKIEEIRENFPKTTELTKRGLAQLLGVTPPTLTQMIEVDYAGRFPVAEEGGKGVGYKFDLFAVLDFLEEAMAGIEDQVDSQADLLKNFNLELPGYSKQGGVDFEKLVKNRRSLIQHLLLEEQLIETARLNDVLEPAVEKFTELLRALPDRLGRQFNLPPLVREAMREEIEGEIDRLVDGVHAEIGYRPDDERTGSARAAAE